MMDDEIMELLWGTPVPDGGALRKVKVVLPRERGREGPQGWRGSGLSGQEGVVGLRSRRRYS